MSTMVSAPLDWSQCPAVESIPGKVGGAWVFKGTRTPVSIVFENLEDGMTVDEIIEQYAITREQINAALQFAAASSVAPSPPSRSKVLTPERPFAYPVRQQHPARTGQSLAVAQRHRSACGRMGPAYERRAARGR